MSFRRLGVFWGPYHKDPSIEGPILGWGPYNKDPSIEGTILGTPLITRILLFRVLYLGSLILGNSKP